jgi:molecular chaperone GrpE
MSQTHDPEPSVKVVDRRWWAQAPAAGDTAQEDAAPRAGSLKPTYVEELEQRLADKDRQLQEVLAKYRDAAREFEDARARMRKEVSKDAERARRGFVADLLEVIDNLELALDAGRRANPDDPLLKGVELVRQQFLAKLEGIGVRRLAPLGQPFDPSRHEAVSVVPVADATQDDVICGVVRTGYLIGDEVLRPALVAVGRRAT